MKFLKYSIAFLFLAFLSYKSVYFKKLDEVKASASANAFNAADYARTFWDTKLEPNLHKAIDLSILTEMLSTDPATAFSKHSNALGIGNLRYFLIKGKGVVTSVQKDDVTIQAETAERKQQITLATEFIFGNAVRDASGLIQINEFNNTMDFNNVSAEINAMIRKNILPPFREKVKAGNLVEFIGAIELNKEHPDLTKIEVIPIRLTIVQ